MESQTASKYKIFGSLWRIGILEYWSNGAQILKYLGAKGQSHKMRTITGIYSCRTQEICSGLNDGNEDKIFIF